MNLAEHTAAAIDLIERDRATDVAVQILTEHQGCTEVSRLLRLAYLQGQRDAFIDFARDNEERGLGRERGTTNEVWDDPVRTDRRAIARGAR